MTADDVEALADEHDIRFIRLWFTDVLGRLKSFSIGREQLAEVLAHGAPFDGSSITGFNPIEESDMVARPDPSTFAILPWRPAEQGVARLFCDIHTPEGAPYEGDPRHVLSRALDRMRALGFERFDVAVEPEYFLFQDAASPRPLDAGGYFDLTTLDAGSDVRRDTVIALEQLGIRVATSHHEAGPAQARDRTARHRRAERGPTTSSRAASRSRSTRSRRGWHATFMPKPLEGENGTGMHTHLSLHKDGRNVFSTRATPTGCPTSAGASSRAAAPRARAQRGVRPVGQLVQTPRARLRGAGVRRLEPAQPLGARPRPRARGPHGAALPDPACNPYLTFAVLLQAGLEGIEKGYELPEPMEKNLYHLSPDDRRRLGIEQLPETLGEAIETTAESELVLRTLGEHMFNRFVELKRQEWEDYRVQVTRWELERYLPVL
jgi:glutamine synthetase